ncbi:hypothetical protein [Cellulomonas sp.]|uniref:hypothetical protein n=1 Tax=Cellulomonas sp. TaxID=40001 RepID=UPI002811408E|nr:hypothetical protein [Cellulomonas sp.]
MRPFRHRPPVPAHVGEGFLAAEAPALQRSFRAALHAAERAAGQPVPADVEVSRGADDRVVLAWRNVLVGFVPESHRALLAAQVDAARPAALTAEGVVHRSDHLWRLWVGPAPEDGFPPPEPGLDTLPAPENTILGIRLPRPDGP